MYCFSRQEFCQPRFSRLKGGVALWIGLVSAFRCHAQSPDKAAGVVGPAGQFDASFHNAVVLLGLGGSLAIAVLIVALILNKREMRRRQQAEAKQKELADQLNSSLEKQVRERTAELDQRSQSLLQEIERRTEAEKMLRQSAERLSGLELRVAERTASLAQ